MQRLLTLPHFLLQHPGRLRWQLPLRGSNSQSVIQTLPPGLAGAAGLQEAVTQLLGEPQFPAPVPGLTTVDLTWIRIPFLLYSACSALENVHTKAWSKKEKTP